MFLFMSQLYYFIRYFGYYAIASKCISRSNVPWNSIASVLESVLSCVVKKKNVSVVIECHGTLLQVF